MLRKIINLNRTGGANHRNIVAAFYSTKKLPDLAKVYPHNIAYLCLNLYFQFLYHIQRTSIQ